MPCCCACKSPLAVILGSVLAIGAVAAIASGPDDKKAGQPGSPAPSKTEQPKRDDARKDEKPMSKPTEAAPDAKKIETAYVLTLSRQPLQAEIELSEAHLKKQREVHAKANVAERDAKERALASLAQALLGSNEFLYVD